MKIRFKKKQRLLNLLKKNINKKVNWVDVYNI